MGVKFGEIDVSEILQNEYRIGVLEGIVDWILTNNEGFTKELTPEEIKKIRQRVVKNLQQKYPKSGIELPQE